MSYSHLGLSGLDLASIESGLLAWQSCLGTEEASVIFCITSARLLVPVQNQNCICVAFCICGSVWKWLFTCLTQAVRVLSECDYIIQVIVTLCLPQLPFFLSSIIFICPLNSFMCVRVCSCIYDSISLHASVLSSFGCSAIVVVLRQFLFVKLVKPAVLHWKKQNCCCCLKWFYLSSTETVC